MEKKISCCGTNCSECEYYPKECKGCAEIKGKVFWLEYTGEKVCEIYECCVQKKAYAHCGQCSELPCNHYERTDPTKSREENDADYRRQMETLNNLQKEEGV